MIRIEPRAGTGRTRRGTSLHRKTAELATRDESQSVLSNTDIAELLAQQAEGGIGSSRAEPGFDRAARRRPVHGETNSKLDGKAAASRENSSGDPPGFHLAGGSAAAPGQTTCLAEKAAWRFTNAQSLERWIGDNCANGSRRERTLI